MGQSILSKFLPQGNIFTSVCQEFCPQWWGMRGRGVCVAGGGMVGGMHGRGRVWQGGMHGKRAMHGRGHAW